MGTFLFFVAVVLIVLGIVFLVLSFKNKTPKKRGVILIIIAILCLILGYISDVATGNFVPDEQTNQSVTESEEVQEVAESEQPQAQVASITSIRAEYKGQTVEGIVLSSKNNHIHVYAEYSDGTESMANDWDIADPQTLTAGETSTVTITSNGYSCDLSVECTTKTQEQIENEYKEECQDVNYEDLARNPDSITGKTVHLTAKVGYVYGDVHDSVGCSAGMTYDETYEMWSDEIYLLVPYDNGTRVLADDVIEIWGTYEGLSNDTDFMVSTNSAPYIEVMYWNFVE